MAYRFIDKYKEFFGLRWLLKHLDIYPNAYYNYRKNRRASYHKKSKRFSIRLRVSIITTTGFSDTDL